MYRLRIKHSQLGVAKFFSHLETMKAWERCFRRADFPVVLTKGYSPRPRLSLAPPLPVGYESVSEYLDLYLSSYLSRGEGGERLSNQLPRGFELLEMRYVPLERPSLMEAASLAFYQVKLNWPFGVAEKDLVKAWENYLKQLEVYSHRNKEIKLNKERDIPMVRLKKENDQLVFNLLLATGSRRTIRPDSLLKPFLDLYFKDFPISQLQIVRQAIYARRGTKLIDLMEA
jgi:radical SAM-linked protein